MTEFPTSVPRESDEGGEGGVSSSSSSFARRFFESSIGVNFGRVVVVAGFFLIWQVAADRRWINPAIYGEPRTLWEAMKKYMFSEQMWVNTKATMIAVGWAFVIGSALGIAAGLLIGANRYIDRVIGPLLVPINTIPRIALAPVFIAWFGLSMTSKVVLAASIVFFILVENSRSALKSLDHDVVTMARVFGVRRLRFVQKVVLPSAVPMIFAGLRLGITYSLLGVVASEMIAARDGLGVLIVLYSAQLKLNYVYAVLIELVLIAAVIAVIFAVIERWLLRWQR